MSVIVTIFAAGWILTGIGGCLVLGIAVALNAIGRWVREWCGC